MRLAIECKEATKNEYGFNKERITAIEIDTEELNIADKGLENSAILTIEIEDNLKRKIIIKKDELKVFANFILNEC